MSNDISKSKDSKMYYISSDIQKIQIKTNMYINEYGEAGAFHLAREIIQNNFDECLDDDSPGNKIEITYNIDTDILKAEDNGRGFNERDYPMNIFVTTLQSGSKFFRNSGAASAGEFGVGLTTVNALSDIFKISSFRDVEGTNHILEYSEGEILKDEIKKNKSNKHGTIVEFRVSKKYMGDEAKLPIEDVVTWVESLFYLDSERLTKKNIKATIDIYDGLKLISSYKFKPQPFSMLLNNLFPSGVKKSLISSIITFNGRTSFIENSKTLIEEDDGTTTIETVDVEKEIFVDVAFAYCGIDNVNTSATYNTFCNYTNTIDNGTHLDAFDESYCRYIQNKVNATMSDSQKDKMKILWDDIRTSFYCVLNLSTNAQVGFVGNAKQKVGSEVIIPYIKEIVTNGLNKYFDKNPAHLNEIIKIVKLNAKARLEAQKAKTATQTERLNSLKEHTLTNYIRPNNTGKQWKELNR